MTAQIGDTYRYAGKKYSLVAHSNPVEFRPATYGIVPESCCTACWAGYWCEYTISEEGIILENLFVNSKDDYHPEINGVVVSDKQNMGHHLYEGINLLLLYSGRIVAGTNFLREYYIHMGYQRAWAYETLLEFVFEKGKLLEVIDHSTMAAKLRKEIEKDPGVFRENIRGDIHRYIHDSFSLDFKTKCWWLIPADL